MDGIEGMRQRLQDLARESTAYAVPDSVDMPVIDYGAPEIDKTALLQEVSTELASLKNKTFIWKTPANIGRRTRLENILLEGMSKVYHFAGGEAVDADKMGVDIEIVNDQPMYDPNAPVVNNSNEFMSDDDILGYSREPRQTVQPEHPVFTILKNRKNTPKPIGIIIDANVPSNGILEILREDYEDANSKILDFIIDSIDTASVKQAIRAAICQILEIEDPATIEATIDNSDEEDDNE